MSSSNGEFSTISSGDMPSLPKSLPSSREATTEGNSCPGLRGGSGGGGGGGNGNAGGGYMPLGDFLDRFSLPRVVRLEGAIGRPVLLYKQQQRSLRVTATLLLHRYRHDVKVAPEIVIPEGYPGWFSVISGNGTTGGARLYRRVETLVRAGVPAFLLAAPLRAYILTHSKMENGNLRAHYTKTTIRAGEVLRLVAIFQDTRRSGSVTFSLTGGSSERDQYAQCLDAHGREVFASLTARGEFYAICQGDASSSIDTTSDAVLYKVQHLARRQLPLRVRLIAGPLPVPLPRDYGGLMQLESSTRAPLVLGCLVPETPAYSPEMLELLVTGPGAPRVRRATLGYPSEARLLASPKMQRLLAACSRAVGDRATEPRVAPQKPQSEEEKLKELHLRKIRPKPESKPLMQSLREGLEQLKRPGTENQQQQMDAQGNGGVGSALLERISKLRGAVAAPSTRSRNPAKKSASFTFAVRPEIAMRQQQHQSQQSRSKTSSLPQSEQQAAASRSSPPGCGKQPVQRSVSTSVLEVQQQQTPPGPPQLQPDYSRVRDSLVAQQSVRCRPASTVPAAVGVSYKQQPRPPDDIYAEICEQPTSSTCSGVSGQTGARSSPPQPPPRIKILVREEAPEIVAPRLERSLHVNSIFVQSGPPPEDRRQSDADPESVADGAIYNTIL